MGFYSFYRIFKDIFKTFFGNKGFKIFLVILLLVFAFGFISRVSAADLRPWNVYTNTTEFNWNRLTKINYTDNKTNISFSTFKISSQQVYYLYNPNSNTGTIRLFTFISNDDNNLLMLYQDSNHQSSYWFEFQYEFNGGYCDIPYNTPFTPQFDCTIGFDNNTSLELYMLDDKYSNIESYNELSALATDLREYFYGQDAHDVTLSSVNDLAVGRPSSGVPLQFYSSVGVTTYYFPVKKGYTYTVSTDYISTEAVNKDFLRHGYTSDIPRVGLEAPVTQWNLGSSFTFTANADTYYYLSTRPWRFNLSVKSNYSSDMAGGLNQQIINQGQETRETLTDSSISQDTSDYSLPSDNTNDITNDGFTSIFDRIRSTFTSGSSTPAVINVPFTNKSFTISKASVFGSAHLGIVQTIIEAFWWFVVSVFIVKDIFKKIEKIKTGNIEFTETTNIKEDLL